MNSAAPSPYAGRRRRIGEVLVAQGLLTEEQLQQCLALQADVPAGQPRRRLGAVVIDTGLATESQIAHALGEALGLEQVDLTRYVVQQDAVRLLPRAVAERSGILVLEKNGQRITCATSDPTNVVALDDVKLYTGANELKIVVATESQIKDHLARAWSLSEDSSDVSSMFEDLDAQAEEEIDATGAADNAPIVRLVDVILADAVRARASDVHIEPQQGDLRVRYRVDGLLRDVMTVPRAAAPSLVSRVKIVSGLDIAERRRPQDGRSRLTVDGSVVEARVSTLPTLHGEKVVVRLLPRAENVPVLTKTGMTERQLETLVTTLASPQGLILITGPTGSGKTNTLYASINQISTPDRNIVTLEDPIEVQIPGISQVQTHERSGLTFATGLRSILRQDPDVVLVGEIRDTETATLALQASLTGHLVLSTLHTNSAVAAITRLVEMGVEPFLVASSLNLVVGQRLVRRPCDSCATAYEPSPRTLELLGLAESDIAGATPRRGKGCIECGNTGYRGRVGVFEVLPVTAGVRAVLTAGGNEAALAEAARGTGMLTLRQSALAAAFRGETTYEEVLRATHADKVRINHCSGCSRAVTDDMVVCPWCSTDVDTGSCRSCSRALDGDWQVCPWCRTPSVSRGLGLPFVPPQPTPAPDAPTGPTLPRVLLIEDDGPIASIVRSTLGEVAEITAVGTAQDALREISAGRFAGVLVDEALPDLSGVELIRLLRSDPATMTVPVLMFTGAATEEHEASARTAGADEYVGKPVEPAHLEERVRALLSRERLSATPV